MQVKHRRNHFLVWVVLAIVLAIGFLGALIFRPPAPVDTQHPGNVAMEVSPRFQSSNNEVTKYIHVFSPSGVLCASKYVPYAVLTKYQA